LLLYISNLITMKTKNNYELVCASKFEEFFYTKDGMPVSEGSPVGVDITTHDNGSPGEPPSIRVDFKLFDDIYWNPPFGEHD